MRRRALLTWCAAGAVGLAGCTGSGAPGGSDGSPTESQTATDSPTPTDTATPTPTDQPTPEPLLVTDRSFEVTDVQCGEGQSAASVSQEPLDGQTGRVVVDGVVRGRDSCHRARLTEVSTDDSDDRLRIAVKPYVPEENEGEMCADCLVDVSYRASVAYEGAGPFDVVVEHDGEQVATTGPYGDS